MKNLLLKWVLMACAMVVAALLTGLIIPGGFVLKTGSVPDALGLFVGVLLLSLANATVGKLLKLLVLPLNCLTLGLVSLVINALLFWWVGTAGWGFQVNGFLPGLLGSILYSAANGVLGIFIPEDDDKDRRSER